MTEGLVMRPFIRDRLRFEKLGYGIEAATRWVLRCRNLSFPVEAAIANLADAVSARKIPDRRRSLAWQKRNEVIEEKNDG